MEEGGNLARTIPTSNPDPDQEQGGLGVWCGVNRQRAERSRALGPVRPTSDATRAANAAQPTTAAASAAGPLTRVTPTSEPPLGVAINERGGRGRAGMK